LQDNRRRTVQGHGPCRDARRSAISAGHPTVWYNRSGCSSRRRRSIRTNLAVADMPSNDIKPFSPGSSLTDVLRGAANRLGIMAPGAAIGGGLSLTTPSQPATSQPFANNAEPFSAFSGPASAPNEPVQSFVTKGVGPPPYYGNVPPGGPFAPLSSRGSASVRR
jgi:hypothetical protein